MPNRDGRLAFGSAIADLCTSADRRLHFRGTMPGEVLQQIFDGRNHIFQSSLDYALGNKHNVAVKEPDAIDPVEARALETPDVLKQFFA